MRAVAFSEGVKVYCPEEGKFSFFNSPYPAHHYYSAVDIYPGRAYGEVAPSPVWGKVVAVRKVRCPEGKGFKGSNRDYVLLLRSLENSEVWVKILHVKPSVEIGRVIRAGDGLGTLIRSGFFDFWTDPHIHVEVRKPSDPIRARGGFKFKGLVKLKLEDGKEKLEALTGIVIESKPEYSLISPIGDFRYGIPVDVNGEVGFLDAGVPHYSFFGVHTYASPSLGAEVTLCGVKIGVVRSVYSSMCVAECSDLNFRLNGKPVRLSLYLFFSKPLLKIVPNKIGELKLRRFEKVSVTIS